MKYKVLSVRQPYASLLVSGVKDVENRSRRTNYRGLVLIHASGKMHDIVAQLEKMKSFGVRLAGIHKQIDAKTIVINTMPEREFSAIIGCVEIVDCVRDHPSEWAEKGQWNWLCKNAICFKNPITDVKGKLGLWDWEGNIPELEERLCK